MRLAEGPRYAPGPKAAALLSPVRQAHRPPLRWLLVVGEGGFGPLVNKSPPPSGVSQPEAADSRDRDFGAWTCFSAALPLELLGAVVVQATRRRGFAAAASSHEPLGAVVLLPKMKEELVQNKN